MPEDLMGTILGEGSGASGDEQTSSQAPGSRGADQSATSPASAGESTILWRPPERVGTTFNLSKQVNAELDRLRMDLQAAEGIRSSNSEITEVALRVAIEEARERGTESELVRRLRGQQTPDQDEETVGGTAGEADRTTRRSVDESGGIVETIYDASGEIVDEEEVGNVADLPVETEYVDEAGKLVTLAKDELGNTFEWIVDDEFNMIGARIFRGAN